MFSSPRVDVVAGDWRKNQAPGQQSGPFLLKATAPATQSTPMTMGAKDFREDVDCMGVPFRFVYAIYGLQGLTHGCRDWLHGKVGSLPPLMMQGIEEANQGISIGFL
jgi:hypothetical protein